MEEYAPTWMVGRGPVGGPQGTLSRFETTLVPTLPVLGAWSRRGEDRVAEGT
jgi:hypothetical protein